MIYLKTSVGIEIRGEDLILSSLQGNLSGAAVTRIQSVANFRQRPREEVLGEIDTFFKSGGLGRDNVVLGIPRRDLVFRHLDLPAEVADNIKQVVRYQVQSYEPTEEDKFYYDYSILPNGQKGKRLLILLIMIRKAILDEYLTRPSRSGDPTCSRNRKFGGTGRPLSPQQKGCGGQDLLPGRSDSRKAWKFWLVRNGALLYSRDVAKGESATWKDSPAPGNRDRRRQDPDGSGGLP